MPKQLSTVPKAVKLPSGSYRCRLQIRGKRMSFTADTAREAQQKALDALLCKKDIDTEKDRKTLEQAMDDFMRIRSSVLSPSTIRGYDGIKRCHIKWLAAVPIRSISAEAWQEAINREKASGLSAKTIKNVWAFCCEVLKAEGLPVPDINLPQRVKKERPFLDDKEIKVFLKEVEGDLCEIPILLALHSLRQSEFLGLRWEDVDLKRDIIHIDGSLVRGIDGMVRKAENKTTESKRDIPILIPRLKELLSEANQGSGIIVSQDASCIYRHVTTISEKAGLPRVSAHCLRHSFASLCYYKDIPAMVTMKLGGWSDINTVMGIYTHISKRQQTQYTDTLKNFFSE